MYRKYTYQGMTLIEYCKQNNIPTNPIYIRIKRLKAKNPDLTNSELVSLAIQKEIMIKHKYTYEGLPLKEYCNQNDISIKAVYPRITSLRQKYPELPDSELLKLAIPNAKKIKHRYTYQGMSLKEYCRKNNLSYSLISEHIRKLKTEKPNLSIEEIIAKVLEKSTTKKVEHNYVHQEISLKEYCKQNNIPYALISDHIRKLKTENPNLSYKELVNKALKSYYNPTYNINRFFYLGTSLKIFCLKNNISYEDTLNYLYSFLTKEENYYYVNELVAYSVERNFLINGLTLKDYCLTNNISYEEIHKLLEKEQNIHYDTKFRTILDSVIYRINKLKEETIKNNESTLTLNLMKGIN